MLKKVLKYLLFFLCVVLGLLAVALYSPMTLLNISNEFSPYRISIDDISSNFNQRVFIAKNLHITHGKNTYDFDTITLEYSDPFAISMHIDNAFLNIQENSADNTPSLHIPDITIDNLSVQYYDIMLSSTLKVTKGVITATIAQFDYSKNILPHINNKTVFNYLSKALEQAQMQDATLVFDTHTSALDINGTLHNVLLYPHKNWQQIDAETIDFHIDNNALTLDVTKGKMGNLVVDGTQVVVDWGKSRSVQVHIHKQEHLSPIVQFLLTSPLQPKLEKVFTKVTPQGLARVDGYLEFYFDDDKEDIINIIAQVKDSTIRLFDKINLQNFTGKLTFNTYLEIRGKAELRNKKVDINLRYDDYLNAVATIKDLIINIDNHHGWLVQLFHKNINADILLNFDEKLPHVHISNVVIHTSDNENITLDINQDDLENFYLTTDNIVINDYKLPNLQANITKTDKQTIHINNLIIEGANIEEEDVIFNGSWQGNTSEIHATATGDKLSSLIKDLNIKKKVSDGKFIIDLQLYCLCNPWEISLKNLLADASFNIKDGSVDTQANDVAKLLSLLSINSISKRLNLDISDLTADGISYDSIKSHFKLRDGVLSVDEFHFDSTAVTMDISGTTNIIDKIHNLTAVVTPAIKDSIPIATYLTGGGLAGLGVWLVDKAIFKDKLLDGLTNDLVQLKYSITGTWDEPIITQ